MIYVSEIERTAPTEYKTDLQKKVYHVLGDLQIPFERVGTDEVITMEDCAEINKKLDMDMVKTFFYATGNRQTSIFLSQKGISLSMQKISAVHWEFHEFLLRQRRKWNPCWERK